MNTKQKGFTLVELLVVIAILGIIMTASIVALNPTEMLKKSRDTRRISDVTSIAKAIASGVADQGLSVSTTLATLVSTDANWSTLTGIVTPTTNLPNYIQKVPVDPTNGACTIAVTGSATCVYTIKNSIAGLYEVSTLLESADSQAKYAANTKDGGDNNTAYEVGTSLTLVN